MVAFYISLASYYSFLVWDLHYEAHLNVNIIKQNKDFISFLRRDALVRLSASTFAVHIGQIGKYSRCHNLFAESFAKLISDVQITRY